MLAVMQDPSVKDGEDASVVAGSRKAADYTGLACLGLLRFVLASGVILFHLWTTIVPDLGRHSVMGFFCISGFLITKIARENYAGRPGAFLLNRFLRIYPAYLFALLFSLGVVLALPQVAAGTDLRVLMPATATDWIVQFTIMGLVPYGLVSPAWTLGIELYFYLIIGLVTCRSEKLTLLCFCLSLVISLLSIFHRIPLQFYFSPIADASVFFAGSVAYFTAQKYTLPAQAMLLGCAGYALSALGLPHLMQLSDYAGPLPNLILLLSLCMVFILLVAAKTVHIHHGALSTGSYYLGRLAYPMFLLHWAVAMPFATVFGVHNGKEFWVSYMATLLVSAFVVQCIDLPIERIRKKVRHGNAA